MSAVVCAMLVGPGEGHRHLDRVLRKAALWSSRLVVACDHVDPDTREALAVWGATIVDVPPDQSMRVNESAARNVLLAHLDATLAPGDLVVCLDADEELVPHPESGMDSPQTALGRALSQRFYAAWPALFVHVWAPDGSVIRTDGGWHPGWQHRVWRHTPGLRIPDRELACGAAPPPQRPCPISESPFMVRHWGYAHPHDRGRKQAHYLARDGGRFHLRSHLESITLTPTLEATP